MARSTFITTGSITRKDSQTSPANSGPVRDTNNESVDINTMIVLMHEFGRFIKTKRTLHRFMQTVCKTFGNIT